MEPKQKMRAKRHVDLSVGSAEADLFGKSVEVGDRYVPQHIFVTFPGVSGQPKLELTIDSSSGVPRCTDLHISSSPDGREVRTQDLRQVDLETWIESIVPLFMDEIIERRTMENGSVEVTSRVRVADSEAASTKTAKKELQKARRAARRKISPELLRRVADVYRSDETRPAQAVQTAFLVSARTAYRYISEARRLGFLEPTKDEQ